MTPWMRSLGLDETQEAAYKALLRDPGTSLRELQQRLRISRQKVQAAVGRLEELGLLVRTPHDHSRLEPVPAEAAVESLVTIRAAELERLRRSIPDLIDDLQGQGLGSRRSAEPFVRLVHGDKAIRSHYLKLLVTVKAESVGFVTGPFLVADDCDEYESEASQRGVRGRYVYDHASLDEPGIIDQLEREASEGVELRVIDRVPMKLVIFDKELAFVPVLPRPEGAEPELLLIGPSRLLDGLVSLFALFWERAVPYPPLDRTSRQEVVALDEEDRRILRLMGTGLKDEAIARNLGLGVRTVRRRVQRLMSQLGAETRFQAGLLAANRGWLG